MPHGLDLMNAGDPRDRARIADGWERRFVADRARAEEAKRLYGELGFEVVADPVAPEDLPDGCGPCRLAGELQFRIVYTRRQSGVRRPPDPRVPPRRDDANGGADA